MTTWDDTLEDERRRWVLVFFDGLPSDGDPLDQIRVMKGMFLLSQHPDHPIHQQQMYEFEPYDWGPFDSTVYRDLDVLQVRGFLTAHRAPKSSQIRYGLTAAGEIEAARFRQSQPDALIALVDAVRLRVVSQTFRALLTDIYEAFPDYAVKSLLRR